MGSMDLEEISKARDRYLDSSEINARIKCKLIMNNRDDESTGCYVPKRYIVTVLGFMGMFSAYALQANLNVAMVAMVNNTKFLQNNSVHHLECPADIDLQAQKENTDFTGVRFDWDSKTQGWVMSAFFYAYFLTMLSGGYLVEVFGATRVFGGGIFIAEILTLLSPLAADWGIVPFIIVRALEGLGEGASYPAIVTIISHWSPKLERSRIYSIILSGSTLGIFVSMHVSGWLCSTDLLGGWPSIFYVCGIVGCLWFVAWCIFVFETPHSHPNITDEELSYFEGVYHKKQKFKVPWRDVVTSVPFWAVMVANFGYYFGALTLFTEFPTYISTVHHLNVSKVGILAGFPAIAHGFGMCVSSYIADRLRISGKLSITTIRKIFTTVAGYSACISLLVVTVSGCRLYLIIGVVSLGFGLNGFVTSGFSVALVDMSPTLAGTLVGLIKGIGNLSGIIAPAMAGAFTSSGYTIRNWNNVFYVSAAVHFVSTTFFAVFASAELQPWGRAENFTEISHLKANIGQLKLESKKPEDVQETCE